MKRLFQQISKLNLIKKIIIGFIIGIILGQTFADALELVFILGVLFVGALNSSTNALFTAGAEFAQWRKEGKSIPVLKY